MKIVKLRDGKRRIGEIVVPADSVGDVRDVATGVFEGRWTEPTEPSVQSRDPIYQNETCTAYPASPSETQYCFIVTPGGTIEVPERNFLLRLLQIL